MNATGLAFGPDGHLYASSRAEGTVYRISPEGAISTYAEGMGIATGIAFDRDGNLFVGDRRHYLQNRPCQLRRQQRRNLRLRHARALDRRLPSRLQQRRHPLRHRPHHQQQPGDPRHRPRRQHHRLLSGIRPGTRHGLRHRGQPVRSRQPPRPARHHPHHATPRSQRSCLRQQPRRPRLPRRWRCDPRHSRCSLPHSVRHRRPPPHLGLRSPPLLLPADVAEHIRVDVQADIGQVVKMFARNQPDNLADPAFGEIARHASKRVRINLFLFCSSVT